MGIWERSWKGSIRKENVKFRNLFLSFPHDSQDAKPTFYSGKKKK